jgi:threonine dehydrogenase-like Zn-dependent dehydrogenase
MLKAKVAFLHGPKDLRLEEVSVSNPGPDQVLIKVGAAGICGSDVECFEGKSKEGRYDLGPYTPGHEWAGEVAAVGSAVKGFAVGDKVTSDCVLNCFKCENCKQGLMPAACLNFREAGFRPDSPGGWGEYLTIEEHYVHKIPSAWTFEEGALVEPFSVGHYGVWGPGGWVDAADDVVVFGGGMIGLCALIVCKAAHANVIVVEPLANRQEYAKRFGADVVIDPRQVKSLADEIAHHTARKRGATVVIEASGNDNAIASLFDVAGLQPRMRLIGHSVGRKVPVEIGKTIWRGISIYGQGGISYDMPRTITFMDRIRRHVDLTQLISHRFSFSRLHDAMETAVLKKAEALKVMLTF